MTRSGADGRSQAPGDTLRRHPEGRGRVVTISGLVAAMALVWTPPAATAQSSRIPAMGNRDQALVASTPAFRFHSDFWLNLHDYLYGIAGGGPDRRAGFEPENADCFAGLGAEAPGWQAAERFYRAGMGERHHRRDALIRSIRYGLAGLALDHDGSDELATVLSLLRGAAPAYRACLWEAHDTRNRAHVGGLMELIVQHGPGLQERLSEIYRTPWPQAVVVDVVSYSDYAGANTASGLELPGHMMLSSARPQQQGFDGLETVHHEASHLVFGPGWGTVGRAIGAAAAELAVDPPRELWHAILFYTAGEATAAVSRAHGAPDFIPYAKRNDMWDWAYPGLLSPLENHWEPYLHGETDLVAAIRAVVAAATDGIH